MEATSSKASMTLGFLSRNFRDCNKSVREQSYTTMVRPTLEYASAAQEPYTCNQINQLDKSPTPSSTFCQQQLQRQNPRMRHCYGKVVGMGTSKGTPKKPDS